jgi:hypothetical protein
MNPKRKATPDEGRLDRDDARESGQGDDINFDPGAYEAPASDEPTPQPAGAGQPPPNAPHTTTATGAPDPFDPAALRLSQDFGAGLGVKKALLSVPVRKPANSWWVRVHPSEEYRLQTAVIELKEDRETYLVAPALWPDLATEATFSPRALFTAINRQGVLFVWPIRLPRADGRADEWNQTALEAAGRATKGWVRVAANMDLGAYDVFEAGAQLGEPAWPTVPLRDLLRIAFRGRFIDSLDHPVLRRLRGEV